jgi:hypothetical protein
MKDNLFKPVEFWADITRVADNRVKQIATSYGFGEVNIKLTIKHGDVVFVTYGEEVAIKQDNDASQKVQKDTD